MLLVFSFRDHPRLRYILQEVLGRLLGLEWQLSCSAEVLRQWEGPVLVYDRQEQGRGVYLPADGLLHENGLQGNVPALLQPQSGLPDDLLSACFYVLSRYEEYLPAIADEHGRFTSRHSVHREWLHRPLVQEWAAGLAEKLQQEWPRLRLKGPEFQVLPTYDIDIPWAYRYRGPRGVASALKDLLTGRPALVLQRLRVLTGREADPFFSFGYLRQLHEELELPARYFWLVSEGRTRPDINPAASLPAVQQLIREVAARHEIGLHPSYQAFADTAALLREKRRLQRIAGREITHSRQHFLRLRLPDTYRQLLRAGIRHDYTMGYADEAGFRAGTAVPFRWYDLPAEQTTDLLVHPFQAMDVTLRNYLQLDPAAAGERLQQLKAMVRAFGGTFCTLWHNSSFSERHGWGGWREIYEEVWK